MFAPVIVFQVADNYTGTRARMYKEVIHQVNTHMRYAAAAVVEEYEVAFFQLLDFLDPFTGLVLLACSTGQVALKYFGIQLYGKTGTVYTRTGITTIAVRRAIPFIDKIIQGRIIKVAGRSL